MTAPTPYSAEELAKLHSSSAHWIKSGNAAEPVDRLLATLDAVTRERDAAQKRLDEVLAYYRERADAKLASAQSATSSHGVRKQS